MQKLGVLLGLILVWLVNSPSGTTTSTAESEREAKLREWQAAHPPVDWSAVQDAARKVDQRRPEDVSKYEAKQLKNALGN